MNAQFQRACLGLQELNVECRLALPGQALRSISLIRCADVAEDARQHSVPAQRAGMAGTIQDISRRKSADDLAPKRGSAERAGQFDPATGLDGAGGRHHRLI